MAHKNLRRLAALTSALLAANSAAGVFAPCYAESDFTAYVAESTEIVQEEYGIRIAKESDEVRRTYEFGDKLELTGIEISGYYNTFDENGKLIKSTDFLNKDLQEMIDNGTVTLDTGDFYTNFVSGPRKITINYGTASTYFYVNVENEKEECSFVIDELPTKTDYILGEKLDLTGAEVSGFFTDGEQIFEFKNADLQELIDDGTITIDTDDFYNYGQKSGSREIVIWYFNRCTSFSVNVIDPHEGYRIDLISPPDKLTYNLGEELDLTGATVSGAVYYGGIHGDIFPSDASIYIENGLLKLDDSEFDNAKPGTYTINLILGHDSLCPDTVSFEVTVEGEEKQEYYSIYIDELPTKTVYQIGEELDITGTKIFGSYTDEELVGDIFPTDLARYLENGMMTLDDSEFDNTKAGIYTIYIHYGTDKASFKVTVLGDATKLPNGDANGDGNFTIADMVMVQKHILGKKSATLSDWKCADLCKDGKIDVYDFIVMRENFVKNMK